MITRHAPDGSNLMTRRTALSASFLLAGAPAYALTPFALIMLPILGTAVVNLFESRRQEELQVRMMTSQLAFQWAAIQMQAGNVEAAHVSYRGALATLGVIGRDVDGHGTMMAIHRGRVYIERDGVGGILTPDEMRQFNGMPDRGEPLPVPLEPETYPSRIDRETSQAAVAQVAKAQGKDADAFMSTQSPGGMRRFASGRTVRYGGDTRMLLTFNRNPSQVGERFGRQVNTYAV